MHAEKCWEYTVQYILLTVAFSNYNTSTYPVIDLHVLKFLLKSMETSMGGVGREEGGNQRQETDF